MVFRSLSKRMKRLLACLSLLVIASQAWASVWMEGSFARYEKFKRPMFIAHLQTLSEKTEPDTILSGQDSFRLELAIAAEYISDRRFNRMLREAMMINSSPETLKKESDNISRFYQFINYDLYRGDHYSVEYHPSVGTVLQVNNMPELALPKSKLGVFVLRGLLGEVPLSTEFRSAMFSKNTMYATLEEEFSALTPDKNRVAQINSEISQQQVTSNAQSKPVEQSKPAAKPSVPVKAAVVDKKINQPAPKKAPAVAKPLEPKPQLAKSEPVKPQPVKSQQKASPEPAAKTTQIASAPPAPAEKPAAAKPSPKAKAAEPKKEKQPVQVASLDTNKAKSDALVSVQQPVVNSEQVLIIQKAYQDQLERKVKKYQTMPYKALSRRMEGDVTLDVAIDRQGNIVDLAIAKGSRHGLLNDQALDAATSAEPFDPIPRELGVEQFKFSVKLKYQRIY